MVPRARTMPMVRTSLREAVKIKPMEIAERLWRETRDKGK
jgi:hypothetical protein